jgi:hypothetical protein
MTLRSALAGLFWHPVELLVKRWNWKAAVSSSLIRATIFFFTNLTAGWHAAAGAMLTEYLYRGLTSGFYGAMTQHLSAVEPEWQAATSAMILLPVASHSLEFVVHYLRHTPNLKVSVLASMGFTVISTLFNFYAMRRGTMVVGANAPTAMEDLRAMPGVVGGFLAALPLWAWRSLRSVSS